MTNFGKALFIAASGFALLACSGETSPSSSGQEAKGDTLAEVPPAKAEGPNYCHGPEYNPEKPFRFVYFNLKIKKDEMTRIRDELKADLASFQDLPQAELVDAVEPYLAKTQILSDLAIQPLADQILPLTATLCNYEIYEKNECKGTLSRSVRKVSRLADSLSYVAPDGRGEESTVFISSRDYSDVMIEDKKATKHWSRSPDGVERFSYVDTISETNWTENPDCSGQLTKRRLNKSIEVTWSSPKTGALKFSFKRCINEKCYEGTF